MSSSIHIYPFKQLQGKTYIRYLIFNLWYNPFPFSWSFYSIILLTSCLDSWYRFDSLLVEFFGQHKDQFISFYQELSRENKCISCLFGKDLVWNMGIRHFLGLLIHLIRHFLIYSHLYIKSLIKLVPIILSSFALPSRTSMLLEHSQISLNFLRYSRLLSHT